MIKLKVNNLLEKMSRYKLRRYTSFTYEIIEKG